MLPKFFFISIVSSIISATTLAHSFSECLDDQKSLLLQLKNELIFDSSVSTKLVQWNERDECCKWYGVEFDAVGNVNSLQLDHEAISGRIGDSSSLSRLKHLAKLNLAYNKLNSTQIPRGIHNLSYLTHLNLSNAVFSGQVPAEISSLRRLVSLDISNDYMVRESLSLEYPNLEMLLQNLTGLRELYLDSALFSFDESRNWSHVISSYLPHLTNLSLAYCSLYGPFASSFGRLHSLSTLRLDYNNLFTSVPDWFANFSSLTTLSLVYCRLNGSFPDMIFQIPTLQYLDLSTNGLSGIIPPFNQTRPLKSIVLSGNSLSGLIPNSISNLKSLSKIDLSFCLFTGSIPATFANLTELVYVDLSYNSFTGLLSSTLFEGLSNLVHLDLGDNSLSGSIPHSLFGLPSLLKLQLSNNKFSGLVEEFPVVNVSNIINLHLSGNQLEGPIPDSFFQLQSLESLLLSGNLFNGTFQLDKIISLANLTVFDLSRNNLSVDVGNNNNSSTYGLSQLKKFCLASCNLSDFPDYIKHSDMSVLDLSNNRISGEIPSWIWGTQLQELNLSLNLLTDMQKPYHMPTSLGFLDLHSNQLRGELHLRSAPNIGNLTSELWLLSLANNSFSGSIPTSLCSATSLTVLDLSVNKLSGTIPSCLFDDTMSLAVLDLGQNNISGSIPDNFSQCRLEYLDLHNNILEGKIPKSLESCSGLEFMNVGNNIFNDGFPCMLWPSLRVLVLHSNKFHGEVRCEKSWPNLQIVDLSSNDFSGNLESGNGSRK